MAKRGPYKSDHRLKPSTLKVRQREQRRASAAETVPEAERVAAPVSDGPSREEAILKRALKIRRARHSLIHFTELTLPDPQNPDDSDRSRYEAEYFHKALAAVLEEVEKGVLKRVIVTMPPRHGKSELTTRRLPAWYIGKHPERHVIVGTYNQPLADTFGRKVRQIMMSAEYQQIFPGVSFQKGSAAADRLMTEQDGEMAFVGRGGSSTGKGAHLLLLDDPIKGRAEANSLTIRNECWDWFNDDLMTRLMDHTGVVIIVLTRWHEDDIVGRLTDPSNPHFNEFEGAQWKIVNIPALAKENDVLGRQVGEALWPVRFPVDFLLSIKARNPKGFASLYQQEPTPEDGDFYTSDMIKTYQPNDRPERLRIYAASDHAVGTKQEHDLTCLMIVGVDKDGCIWLLDVYWKRAKTDVVVEAMIDMMDKWKPLTWWAENGHISKSIGPFLYRRMRERGVFCKIVEQTPSADKPTRSQSIQGRMSMGLVRFPKSAWWASDARTEMLKFPGGRHDDFCDALAHVGMGLENVVSAGKARTVERELRVGSFAWVKWAADKEKQARKHITALRGQ